MVEFNYLWVIINRSVCFCAGIETLTSTTRLTNRIRMLHRLIKSVLQFLKWRIPCKLLKCLHLHMLVLSLFIVLFCFVASWFRWWPKYSHNSILWVNITCFIKVRLKGTQTLKQTHDFESFLTEFRTTCIQSLDHHTW